MPTVEIAGGPVPPGPPARKPLNDTTFVRDDWQLYQRVMFCFMRNRNTTPLPFTVT